MLEAMLVVTLLAELEYVVAVVGGRPICSTQYADSRSLSNGSTYIWRSDAGMGTERAVRSLVLMTGDLLLEVVPTASLVYWCAAPVRLGSYIWP